MAPEPPLPALPRIRRARGFRLYDEQGRRYIDLYRDGALLGHRSERTLNAMKAALSQGLAARLPSAAEARLESCLARLFPGFPIVRLFASRDGADAAAARWLGVSAPGILDPALCPSEAAHTRGAALVYWRPFLPAPASAGVLLPILPLTVGGSPAAACFPGAARRGAPAGDTIPGVICAAALRALGSLSAPGTEERFEPSDARLVSAFDGRRWARVGPYVRALFPAEDYARVHAEFLRAGVLLAPRYPGPSVLPGECSPGEARLLAELFAGTPQ